jgi:FkbM family methyltransferase
LKYLLRSLRYEWIRRVERPGQLVVNAGYCGLRFTTATGDRHARKLFKHRVHEPSISAWLVEHLRLRPGEVALDVGANIGWYSLLFDRLAEPAADVFAFEPDPDNRLLLERNIALNQARRVHVVPFAVSDSPGTATLHRFSGGNRGQHTLLPLYSGDDVEVRTVTLDEFWNAEGLGTRPLRLVKIDIEGHEAAAIRGGSRALARCGWLLMEYSPKFMRGAGLDPEEPLGLLTRSGLVPYIFEGESVRPVRLDWLRAVPGQVNVLWAREPLTP